MSSRLAAKMQASPTMLVALLQLHDGLVTAASLDLKTMPSLRA
jgi:hypothetical protein